MLCVLQKTTFYDIIIKKDIKRATKMGINVAEIKDQVEYLLFSSSKEKCIFISYKKEDKEIACKIGDFLKNEVDVNIYLDLNDSELKESVILEDNEKIVNSIKTGLECSTHLLCLVSDKTKLSWWVPYEIGYADKKGLDIASLKLSYVDDIPEYLKIKKAIYNKEEFADYLCDFLPYSYVFFQKNREKILNKEWSPIEKFID